nr:RING-H2 finger protein ATL48-like [Ipomoea batatas]GMD54088.1 RING-H2 finger protein ATL48-like [Ipomoea batatas]GMD56969.1 RING-H2 finger protein ATL48-like [Ipomoea batatas]
MVQFTSSRCLGQWPSNGIIYLVFTTITVLVNDSVDGGRSRCVGGVAGGALITAGVLTAGLISFRQGNSNLGQKLMRARVVAQGATVALMVGTAYYYGDNLKHA